MVDDKYIELMQLSLDGSLSADQKADLNEYLNHHPDASEYFESLKRADRWLHQIPRTDPPPKVTQNILAAIKKTAPLPERRASLWSWIRNVFPIRLAWRYAYVFVVGVLCGISILAVSNDVLESTKSVDPKLATGTMITSSSFVGFAPLDSTSFHFDSIGGGSLVTKAMDNQIILDIDIVSQDETAIAIQYNIDDLAFAGFRQNDYFPGSVIMTDSFVTLKYRGDYSLTVLFIDQQPETTDLVIEIKSGSASHSATLVTGR